MKAITDLWSCRSECLQAAVGSIKGTICLNLCATGSLICPLCRFVASFIDLVTSAIMNPNDAGSATVI